MSITRLGFSKAFYIVLNICKTPLPEETDVENSEDEPSTSKAQPTSIKKKPKISHQEVKGKSYLSTSFLH